MQQAYILSALSTKKIKFEELLNKLMNIGAWQTNYNKPH